MTVGAALGAAAFVIGLFYIGTALLYDTLSIFINLTLLLLAFIPSFAVLIACLTKTLQAKQLKLAAASLLLTLIVAYGALYVALPIALPPLGGS